MARTLLHSVIVASWVLVGLPGVAWAQIETGAAPSGARHEVRGQIAASINNAGLQNTLDASWTWRTSRSTHPLLSGAHIAAGATSALTPTQVKFGGWIEYSPLSILDVRAGADPSVYFGTFDSLMGFSSYDQPFDPDSRKARGGAKIGNATRVYLSPTLKFKAGPIVASTTTDIEWWRSSADAAFFYEPTRDTILKSDGDRLMTTTSVLMYQWAKGPASLSVGGLHTMARVDAVPDNRIQKLGVIAIKEFGGPHFRLTHPRVTLVVARYLKDPFKKDQWTAAMAIGFRTGR